jgi:hypothetical protein
MLIIRHLSIFAREFSEMDYLCSINVVANVLKLQDLKAHNSKLTKFYLEGNASLIQTIRRAVSEDIDLSNTSAMDRHWAFEALRTL